MKLVLTLVVRNEADIIEAFLRHHLAQGVDHVLVTDHGSDDATPDVLAAFAASGDVSVTRVEDRAFRQDAWVTAMARAAAVDHRADWVINADADEFFLPAVGTLADVLAEVPEGVGRLSVPRNDLVPRPDDGRPALERMDVREVASVSPLGFPLLPKVVHRGTPEVTVGLGNHGVEGVPGEELPPVGLVDLVHAPYRSWEQVQAKVRTMGEAKAGAEESADHRHLHDLLQRGELEAWWREKVLDDTAVARGVAEGRLVIDRRLAGGGADADAARTLVAERVPVAIEWVEGRVAAERRRSRAELDRAVARVAELEGELAVAQQRVAVLDEHLADARRWIETALAERRALESRPAIRVALRAERLVARRRP